MHLPIRDKYILLTYFDKKNIYMVEIVIKFKYRHV